MSQPRLNDLLERAELALNRARSERDASSALRERAALDRELRDLLRSATSVETKLVNALLTSNRKAEQRLIGNALAEAKSVRAAIEELMENAGGGGETAD
jgi:hypothetical protein